MQDEPYVGIEENVNNRALLLAAMIALIPFLECPKGYTLLPKEKGAKTAVPSPFGKGLGLRRELRRERSAEQRSAEQRSAER